MDIDPRLLAELRRPDRFTLFITGAGISLASGIPTFRGTDPGAVWKRDVLEMGTLAFFHRNPVESWKWYLDRFAKCRNAEPNPAHHAITEIERKVVEVGSEFLLLTQNVDGLHLEAGTKNVIEVHGAARKMRCSKRNCVNGAPAGWLEWDDSVFDEFRADPRLETIPRCPVCHKLIRAHVLWFDESYADHESYGLDTWLQALSRADSMVFIGTSFSVAITESCLEQAADFRLPAFIIDPGQKGDSRWPDNFIFIPEKAEEYLPAVAEAL